MLSRFVPDFLEMPQKSRESLINQVRDVLKNPKNSKQVEDLTNKRGSNKLPFDDIESNLLKRLFKTREQQECVLQYLYDKGKDSKAMDLGILLAEFCPRQADTTTKAKKDLVVRKEEPMRQGQYDEEINLEDEVKATQSKPSTAQPIKSAAEQEAERRKKAEEAKKKREEEAAKKKKEEEEAEAARKKKEEEEAAKKKKEQDEREAARKKKEEEEAAAKKKKDEEAAALKKKQEEEAAILKKKQEEEVARKKKEEEEAAAKKKKEEEEAAAKKKQEEEAAALKKKKDEEAAAAAKKKKDEEEAAAAKKKKEEEEAAAAKKKKEEEEAAAKRKKEEEEQAAKKKKEEEEAAALKKKAEDEAAKKKKEEEEAAKKKKEAEDAARKKQEEEQEREQKKMEELMKAEKDKNANKKNAKNLDDFLDDFEPETAQPNQQKNSSPFDDEEDINMNAIEQPKPKKIVQQPQEENFDHLDNDPEVDKAAQKIQASFRGKQDRKKVEEMKKEKTNSDQVLPKKDATPTTTTQVPKAVVPNQPEQKKPEHNPFDDEDLNMNEVDTKKPAHAQKEEEPENFDHLDNDPDVDKAAQKIQASFRGKQARKQVEEMKKDAKPQPQSQQQQPSQNKQSQPSQNDSPKQPQQEGQKQKNQEPEDFAHLDNDPDVDKAAQKIQASFRGKQDRKKVEEMKKEQEKARAATPKPQDKSTKNKAEDFSHLDNDPEAAKAAQKIQASFRGNQDRKRVEELRQERKIDKKEKKAEAKKKKEAQENFDHLDNDPDVGKAAQKIQASFRGKQDRKKVEEMKKEKQHKSPPQQNNQAADAKKDYKFEEPENFDHLDNDPDVDKAAQKIQANFRGKQDRKKVEEMKKEQDKAKQPQQPLQQSPKQPQRAPAPNQTKEESDAALRIQSQYRGNKDRQRVQDLKKEQEKTKAQQQKPAGSPNPNNTNSASNQKPNNQNIQKVEEPENFDHLDNDPDVDKAAQKIQANFRGKQDRKKVEEMKKDAKPQPQPQQQPPTQQPKAVVQQQSPNQPEQNKPQPPKNPEPDFFDDEDLNMNEVDTKKPAPAQKVEEPEDFAHLDNDPDVDKAAQKIQASFRGKQARKQVEEMKKEQEKARAATPKPQGSPVGKQENKAQSTKPDLTPAEKRNQDAAIKIQSRYRGNRDRERIQEMKKNRAGFAPKTYEEMFGHTTKTQEQDAKRIQENYNKVKDPSKVDLVHPDQHKEHSNRDNQKAQEVEEPPLDDPLMDMITGKIKIAINQVFINKEVELLPHYSLAILVKAGERSKFSLIRIQIKLR